MAAADSSIYYSDRRPLSSAETEHEEEQAVPYTDDITTSPSSTPTPDEKTSPSPSSRHFGSNTSAARLSALLAAVSAAVIFAMLAFELAVLALAGTVLGQNTQTSTSAVYAAQATAKASSPVSHVPGLAFDRIAIIWLENTDYTKAAGDPNLAWLASKGQVLSNYYGTTHPSEPNYVASHGGDNFGMDNDNFNMVPANISTVIDLLEARGISWGAYQEDMPYAGFEGYAWKNQKTQANDYVRKHNPPVIYNANANSPQRLSQMKNTTSFYKDLANNQLPQWMFITPNMTSDGHDSSVTVAGAWTRNFLEPLLTNKNFMQRTLVLITFDENHTYTIKNNVFSILLGDALPANLVGTTDSNYYDHYSEISTVEANWFLNTLGRWDVGANVFKFVADRTGDQIRPFDAITGANPSRFLNGSYAGAFNSNNNTVGYPLPNLFAVQNGRTVLPSIVEANIAQFIASGEKTIYQNTVQIPDCLNPPVGYTVPSNGYCYN